VHGITSLLKSADDKGKDSFLKLALVFSAELLVLDTIAESLENFSNERTEIVDREVLILLSISVEDGLDDVLKSWYTCVGSVV